MKAIVELKLRRIDNKLVYIMDWSDNPKYFKFTHEDEMKVLEVKNKLESRMDNYLAGNTHTFITSDIDKLQYISK